MLAEKKPRSTAEKPADSGTSSGYRASSSTTHATGVQKKTHLLKRLGITRAPADRGSST